MKNPETIKREKKQAYIKRQVENANNGDIITIEGRKFIVATGKRVFVKTGNFGVFGYEGKNQFVFDLAPVNPQYDVILVDRK